MGTMSTFSGITYRIYLEVSFHSKTVQVLHKQCRRTYQSYASASIVHCYKGLIFILAFKVVKSLITHLLFHLCYPKFVNTHFYQYLVLFDSLNCA